MLPCPTARRVGNVDLATPKTLKTLRVPAAPPTKG
jgi:hypothetical protein